MVGPGATLKKSFISVSVAREVKIIVLIINGMRCRVLENFSSLKGKKES